MSDDLVKRQKQDALYENEPWAKLAVLAGFRPYDTEASGRSAFRFCAKKIDALTAQLAEDADARALVDDRLKQLVAQVDALTAERDHAWEMAAKADTQMGQSLADNLQAKAERDRLREALERIEITCDEEVCVRTAGMSEAALGKSRILPLLQIPRNIAHAALKGEAEPNEYERKVTQMKEDFPNGI